MTTNKSNKDTEDININTTQINFDLEGGVDFGSDKLNNYYKSLDRKIQGKIKEEMSRESAIKLLEIMSNPLIQTVYDSLTAKEQIQLNKMNITNKFLTLNKMLEKKVKETEFALSINGPKTLTPDGLPLGNKPSFVPKTPSDEPKTPPLDTQQKFEPKTPPLDTQQKFELKTPSNTPPELLRNVPSELEEEDEEEKETRDTRLEVKRGSPQERIDNLIKRFYSVNPFINADGTNHELEVRFGTKGIKPLTRNDYDNVIKKLKSFGFNLTGETSGLSSLRINCEFLDSITGKFKMSDIRTEINGIHNIQSYCKNNDAKTIYKENPTSIQFVNKKKGFINKEKIFPVDVDDFNFRVSYQTEITVKSGIQNGILENWRKSKKEFRFINRVSFEHPDYPFIIDISIVKYGNKHPDKFGRENRGSMIRVYNIEDSNVFNNQEVYEIEIEINNHKIGPATEFNSPQSIANALRKVIKFVLGGLQGTNYPISYPEQKHIIESYMKMVWKDAYDPKMYINSKNFIGPNSITLQLVNIAPLDENSNQPNIRKDFVVTDKADGQRHLMFISNNGKIYLINTNMDVIFTGAKTNNKDCFNSIFDGELIYHDKNGKFINLYAAFDVYFIKNIDVRGYTFMLLDSEEDIYKSRYQLLRYIQANINPVSIMDTGKPVEKSVSALVKQYAVKDDFLSPIRIVSKEFYPNAASQTIFDGCNLILQKEREGRFEYTTDGLILSHAYFGVGSSKIGKVQSNERITWEYSFKWKPPQYNTVDFLVTTEKSTSGEDVIKTLFEDGVNTSVSVQIAEYKPIVLRCGFREKYDGYINPCQDIIDDNLPDYVPRLEENHRNDYVPKRFYPTEPFDENAGLCNIMLRSDGFGGKKMFSEENQVFEDNTIVEFRYDLSKEEGWRWVPLRVRYDKTAKLRRGEKEYGNAYKVCNENWKSIHPSGRITEDMIATGLNIPSITVSEDVYYNTPAGKFKTEAMKNFHNLYVKKLLIVGVSKQGDTLIDFACGRAGDLPKWISAKLSFVFGVDLAKQNLENRIDGACARYLNLKKTSKFIPAALFVNGNSAFNIKDGSAMLNDKAKQITAAVFGNGPNDVEKIGKGVSKQYGKGAEGFNIAACQFAIHYFFENPDTLKGFMKNLVECTKINGYFVGCCYDGKLVFNDLKKINPGESIQIIEEGKKIWEITKSYSSKSFDNDSSSIGYRIDVFQESINQTISEYLVNFEYLNRVMSAYGFELVTREEALEFGLPDGSGLFNELFINMLEEINKNKFKAKDYGKSALMTSFEKKISFLNRYFVYKKIRNVNVENVELDLGEYENATETRDKELTSQAINIAKEEVKELKPKVRKLNKKLLLVAATEAVDEEPVLGVKKSAASKKTVSSKKVLLIEEDSDEEK